jgi:NAD(P)-dependent dehydrogenase (short-subunit alcohol dehydrogenase family)
MFNPLNLTGRSILVTGASSGIGRATCVVLSRLGARLILVARSQQNLEETRCLLDGDGHIVETCDLRETDAIPGWLKQLGSEHGPLDGLVHSAGVHTTLPLQFMSGEQLNDIMRVNFTAAMHLAKGFRQRKVHTPVSSVVFVSSVMGLVGQAGVSAYVASKGALIAVARSLSLELAGDGIRVNCVAPGQVESKMAASQDGTLTDDQRAAIEAMHPLGIGQPEDVANSIAFLLADTGRWITGTTLVVDGGYTAH